MGGSAIDAHPTTKEALLYQSADGFVSSIVIGGAAPDGAVLRLDGTASTMHEQLDRERLTILNFGSCT